MRFHKIEMVGRFNLQKVSTLPVFDASRDEGRLVYNLEDENVYQGSSEEWGLMAGGGDLDGDALLYYFLLNDSGYEDAHYETFSEAETVQSTGSPLPQYDTDGFYTGSDGSEIIFTAVDTSPTTLYQFYTNVESENGNFSLEYSIDDGTTWTACNNAETTHELTGFTDLLIKVIWTDVDTVSSIGVLYTYTGLTMSSAQAWSHEKWVVDADYPANTVIDLPNEFICDAFTQSLRINLNNTTLIIDEDYEIVNQGQVKFLIPLETGWIL